MTKRQSARRRSARRVVVRHPALYDASQATSGRKRGKPGKRKRGGIAAGKKPRFRADKPRRSGGGGIQVGNLPAPLTDEQKKANRERVDQGLENAGQSLGDIGTGIGTVGHVVEWGVPGGQEVGLAIGATGEVVDAAGRVLENPNTRAPITKFTTDQVNAETERLIDSASQDAGEQQMINAHVNALGF
jgi:hypothetical protein